MLHRLQSRAFRYVHQNHLVYNTCWEDPRLDREALTLGPSDDVVVITSAGCNALDYILAGARNVFAVDMNPRQNALLALKVAAISNLEYEDFFAMFGKGRLKDAPTVYRKALRAALPEYARTYWDRHIAFFGGKDWRSSFYFRGSSGLFARFVNLYVDRIAKMRESIDELLNAPTLAEQAQVYESSVRPAFWTGIMRWLVNRDSTLALVGVPPAQRAQVESTYRGGIVKFIEDSLDAVFGQLPLQDNYFYRVYLTGEYSPNCCPEYLKEANFRQLKEIASTKVHLFNGTLVDFLDSSPRKYSRFVLLDHMDWLSTAHNKALAIEWQSIVDHATSDARVIWRSGGLQVGFVDPIPVKVGSSQRRVGELLRYHPELAERLHRTDRVHTYGSFYIADLAVA